MTRLVVAGGGTGGHLYPGIAVARELLRRQPDARVSFAGTAAGIEARVVPAEGFELDLIRSTGIKGKSLASRAGGLLRVPLSLGDAWQLLSKQKPHVVMGVGGYSSGPVVLAAALRRIPTLVLEQNAVPGMTNRTLAPFVRAAAVSYEQTLTYFKGRGFVTGNPVRDEFFAVSTFELRGSDVPRVLILGGSQGAHAINVAMVAAAPELVRRVPGLALVHQTGDRDVAATRDGYTRAGIDARAAPFFPRVAGEMAEAHLVISRAGATTLAELAAAGRPAVLIPFPGATDDHQRKNAAVVAAAGGAVVLDQRDLTAESLANTVADLISNRARLEQMAAAMRSLARRGAAGAICDRLLELAGTQAGAA